MHNSNPRDDLFAKYEMIFDHSPFGICITEIDGSIKMNNTFCEMLGYTKEQLFEAGWNQITYKEDISKHHELFDIYSGVNDSTKKIEKRFVKKDGTLLWAEVVSKLKSNGNGQPEYLLSMIRDISEYKTAKEELIQNEIKFKQLFDNNPNPMWLYDTQTLRFLMVNEAAIEKYGYSEAEFLNMTIRDIRPPEDIELLENHLNLNNSSIVDSNTWRHRKKDGTKMLIKISAHSINYNGGTARVTTAIDVTEKVADKNKLIDEAAKHRSVIESTSDAVFSVDKNYCYTSFNKSHSDIMKKVRKATIEIGKNFLDYIVIESEKITAKANIDKALNGQRAEESITLGNDVQTQIHLNILHNPITNGIGEVIGVSVFAKDITELKLSAGALYESQHFIEGIVNAIPVRVFWKDKNLVYIGCNKVFANDAGFSDPKEIVGKNDYQMVWKDQAELYQSDDHNVIESGEPRVNFEEPQTTPDGKQITLLTSKIPLRNLSGECIGLLGTYIDITEQKNVFNKVKQMSKAVEQSPATIIITDTEGNIQYVNPKGLELTGYTLEELLNKNPRILSSGERTKLEYRVLWNTIKAGDQWRGEFHNKKKNGELYWESASISPIVNDNGEITNFLAIKEDITEQKQILQDLIAAKEKAEEINKIKSVFFSNMSHELRTPLVGILGFADLLSENLEDENDKSMAISILQGGKRLLNTLTTLLSLSELETLKESIELIVTDINPICQDMLNYYSTNSPKDGVQYKIEFESNKLELKVNTRLFREAINQIIKNAVIYTDSGYVLIKTYKKLDPISKEYSGIIEVTDTGIGIPKEKREIIFEEFRQASEGLGRSFEGTGLGLTLSKKYLELMNASISIEDHIGGGSKFILKFPSQVTKSESLPNYFKSHQTESTTLNITKRKKVKFDDKRILIVEDDPINKVFLEKCLSNICASVSTSTGADAIKLASENSFNLILMDINLGKDMDGITATKIIRKINGYENSPIVAMTAYASNEDREEFLSMGCSHFLPKPFLMNDLSMLLEEAFQNN